MSITIRMQEEYSSLSVFKIKPLFGLIFCVLIQLGKCAVYVVEDYVAVLGVLA